MGGLGPTEDDLTRESVAEALSLKLKRDAPQVAALHARAATWRIAMPENNLKQADLIEGAIVPRQSQRQRAGAVARDHCTPAIAS